MSRRKNFHEVRKKILVKIIFGGPKKGEEASGALQLKG